MKLYDYIIVGCGLASIAFVEKLRSNHKTFLVFDDASQQSSIVAAGLYNPIVLKRFTKVWQSKEQLSLALPMYKKIEQDLNLKIDYKLKILRRFTSIEEQNQWFDALEKPNLGEYMSQDIVRYKHPKIEADHYYGEVLGAGRVDTNLLVKAYKLYLTQLNVLVNERFNYNDFDVSEGKILYNSIQAKHIVFAEGFGVKQNPYFNTIPLNGTKGELIIIKAPDLNIDFAIKSSVFIIPLGNDLYKVGSTYNRDDKTNRPTEEGKNELIKKMKTFLHCDYEIVKHSSGIRPTTKDRRPLVGQHRAFNNLYVLNGLGSRGVMVAPYVADKLYNLIEHGTKLDLEIDVNRFD